MLDDLTKDLESAVRRLQAKDDPASVERAAALTKTLSEIRKAEAEADKARVDAKISAVQSRTSRAQVLASIAVPLVSVLTVLATVYLQSQQLTQARYQSELQRVAAQEAAEDARWNAFLAALKGTPDSIYADSTLISRLRTFTQSPRYREQATDIAKRLMTGLSTSTSFRDVYEIAFPRTDLTNIDGVAELGRLLRAVSKRLPRSASSIARI
jgi:hypothetical protein